MAKARRILFVCEGNLHRSPTAQQLYAATPGIRSRSAGLSDLARVQVTDELLAWAHVIFVMEKRLRNILQQRFAESLVGKELICLNVPDEFQFQQPELVVLLTEKLAPHLGPPNIDDIPDATPDSPSRKMRDGNDRDRGDSVAGFRGGATNGDAFSLTNLNLNLNPGGIIGGFSGAVFGFLTLGPNFKAGMTQLILICIVGGAFAGNLLWRLLFGQPKSDRETEDNIE